MLRRGAQGFTLIEFLIVLVIIIAIVASSLVVMNRVRRSGRDTRRQTDLREIQLALERYYEANREYPQASTVCNATVARGLQLLVPMYLPRIPRDPLSGTCYSYATYGGVAADATTYHLAATIEGKVPTDKKGCHSENTTSPACFKNNAGAAVAANSGTGINGAVAQAYDVTP